MRRKVEGVTEMEAKASSGSNDTTGDVLFEIADDDGINDTNAGNVLFDIDDDGMTTADSLNRNYLESDYTKKSPRLSSSVAEISAVSPIDIVSTKPDFLSSVSRVYIVSCTLPVQVVYQEATGEWEVIFNQSQITARHMPPQIDTWWCGMIAPANVRRSDGSQYSQSLTNSDKFGITCALRKANCAVIWIQEELLEGFDKYCRQVLWPLMHNVIVPAARDLHASVKIDGLETKLWEAYDRVNQLFAFKLSTYFRPKQLIWVHGYQLMLLPAKIRRQLHPSNSKRLEAHQTPGLIYYLHLPFPTSEIFRTLHHRTELLMGILGADLIAFHLYNYLRHFLNICHRLLFVHYEREAKAGLFVMRVKDKFGSRVYSRNVGLRVNNVVRVLPLQHYEQMKRSPKVQAMAQALRDKHKGKTLVVGMDRCNRMTGMSLKLLAFEHLLNMDKSKAKEVVLVQRALLDQGTKRFNHPANKQSLSECNELLERINKAHGRPGETLIDFEVKQQMTIEERCAMWLAGDIYVHCAVCEGLNLKPFEFVYCQPEFNPGLVIISEFSGAAQRFGVEDRINPYNIADVASKITRILEMDPQRRGLKYRSNARKLKQTTAHHWTTMVLRDVKNMWYGWQTPTAKVRRLETNSSYGSLTDIESETDYGLLAIFDNSELKEQHRHRSPQQNIMASCSMAVNKYSKSKRRLVLLFDHIRKKNAGKESKTTSWILRASIHDKIHNLSTNPQNQVFVVSSPLCSFQSFKDRFSSLPFVGLVMHDGTRYSWPVKVATEDREWTKIAQNDTDTSWRTTASQILKEYSVFINGSKVEASDPTRVRLNFSKSDRDWGSSQATTRIVKELRQKLNPAVAIINSPPVVDVRLKNIVLQSFISKRLCFIPNTHVHLDSKSPPLKPIGMAQAKKAPDFILCIGCDADAHEVFEFLDDTKYVDPTATSQRKTSPRPLSASMEKSQLVPLARRMPDCFVATLSIHNQRSVEHYCNSLPFGSGRYFSNGLKDVSMLLRSMAIHSTENGSAPPLQKIVSEDELLTMLR